jgi:hypothetical protein
MTWAVVAGAVIAGGATYLSSQNQADAVNNAANTQAAGANASAAVQRDALQFQKDVYTQGQNNFAPWLGSAMNWLPRYSNEVQWFIDGGPQRVQQEPGYQFGLEQGQKAIDRKTAAAGGRVSGAAMKQASRYATDYATAGYDAAYKRSLQRLDRIAQMAGYAPIKDASAAAQSSANSISTGSNALSNVLSQGADNAASAQLARGNIYGGAFNQLAAYGSRGFGSGSGTTSTTPDANPWLNTDVYS